MKTASQRWQSAWFHSLIRIYHIYCTGTDPGLWSGPQSPIWTLGRLADQKWAFSLFRCVCVCVCVCACVCFGVFLFVCFWGVFCRHSRWFPTNQTLCGVRSNKWAQVALLPIASGSLSGSAWGRGGDATLHVDKTSFQAHGNSFELSFHVSLKHPPKKLSISVRDITSTCLQKFWTSCKNRNTLFHFLSPEMAGRPRGSYLPVLNSGSALFCLCDVIKISLSFCDTLWFLWWFSLGLGSRKLNRQTFTWVNLPVEFIFFFSSCEKKRPTAACWPQTLVI